MAERADPVRSARQSDPQTFLLGATLDPIIPGTEEMWPTFGIRYSFFVESHDQEAVSAAREKLWEGLSDVVAAAAEVGARFEYRLVLEGPLTGEGTSRLRDEEHARKMADYWNGRVSQSTGDSGRVEFRAVSEWQMLEPNEASDG